MAMDCEAQILYVFGGRVLDGDWDTSRYSGLYSYNVRLSRWRSLQLVNYLLTVTSLLTTLCLQAARIIQYSRTFRYSPAIW